MNMAEKRSTIVLLDKDPNTLELYRRELAVEYSVITCRTVDEVQDLLQQQKFDILVMEPVGLGDKGWILIDKIKAISLEAAIPIVICSTQSVNRAILQKGATTCLVKPVIPEQLHSVIRQILPINHMNSTGGDM
jgi:response regulator RpfG family c-di-GMP phosphodiesterase